MFDLIYRFDTTGKNPTTIPLTAQEAQTRLEDGNREFAMLALDSENAQRVIQLNASALGLATSDGKPPLQRPFAAVLGCADARVPIELIFSQAANDLFVVRVAGNVLGTECLGSLDFAVSALGGSLRLIVVLGHSYCGAVSGAAEAFMNPHKYLDFTESHPLRTIIERILVSVRSAHRSLELVYGQQVEDLPGYRSALIEASVSMNAAMTAASIRQSFRDKIGPTLDVVYGVYNLVNRTVRMPPEADANIVVNLAIPPTSADGFNELGLQIARSKMIAEMVGVSTGE